ncbi:MAG TPA: 3-isopropylmalate dehydrogenase [Thermoanaerobaculia bacterium]|jgi:3-isopropylmalate dehydrogenase|nr:3-isopropylmalate dehydrogenase [Thermoanaerobaculia bacterium]
MRIRIAVLPGDGIGPEVTREAVDALVAVAAAFGHEVAFVTCAIGGAALETHGVPLPPETLDVCLASDAVLLGAVGNPRWDGAPAELRPEAGLLALRRALGTFANLRPVRVSEGLASASPLKREIVSGTDLVFVRELLGGLYFGEPRRLTEDEGLNTLVYTAREVERVARVAFDLAGGRGGRVTSVDKANVLESSRLWRRVVTEVATDYPGVTLEHLYVDAAAMALVSRPKSFDVVVAENLFGDILSDEAAVLTGSLGLLPSASLGGRVPLFEPVHGSAPDIAGTSRANPLGAISSAALLLRHACGLRVEAMALEAAVEATLRSGFGTPDIASATRVVGTRVLGEEVRRRIGDDFLLTERAEKFRVARQ